MGHSMREILAAWACCSLVGLGALLIAERDRPAIAVYAGVQIPGRSGSTAPGLSIVEEFADDAREDAGTVSNRGGPSLYSRQEVAESQRCWLRPFGRRLL
jgi:ATP-dependent protease HslVU (ClpYQ) peptidase subunit